MPTTSLTISFSSVNLKFLAPEGTQFPVELTAFCTESSSEFDAEYDIRLQQEPLKPIDKLVYTHANMCVYPQNNGQLRTYTLYNESDGCQVACFLRPDGRNTLYFPVKRWQSFSASLHCLPYLAPELFLLHRNAFLLHSSVVTIDGKAILFAGPSGSGKSTQAELWKNCLHAEILNGDRCIIMKKGNTFFGGGSPWCGSSAIYDPRQFPISAILLLAKGNDNTLDRITHTALPSLLSQTLVNCWDTAFMKKITDLYADLLSTIPIYRLVCRPDKSSVELVHQTIFGKEK